MPQNGHETAVADVEAYLRAQEDKTLLRLITCGSVDDGKSTLLGRLLYDCKLLFEDQLASLQSDSARFGSAGTGELDLALLVDGLAAEREQGITIDVAYRFFTTDKRKFIVADTPGHEQYTRNMATGASTAEVAILLVDARKGMLTQTRRHSYIAALLGIRHLVLAVNKMDLVDWQDGIFDTIAADFKSFAANLGEMQVTCIPVSALTGDNISRPSAAMPWYQGPTLLTHLETLNVGDGSEDQPFRMPVQWVNRPNLNFRGFAGSIASGAVQVDDPVVILPSGKTSTIESIATYDGPLTRAQAGQAVTLVLQDEVDVSRGDVIAATTDRPVVADQFAAHIVWMHETPMLPGRTYQLRLGSMAVNAQVTEIKHSVNVNTLERMATKSLDLNDVAFCNLSVDQAIPFDPYSDNRTMGAFILVDRMRNATVGCGMIDFALRRAANIHHHAMTVTQNTRAAAKQQKPCVLWFTGLSGAGKSTIADLVEQRLHDFGHHTMLLDGDNVRFGLNRDLGFSDEDRVENIRRVGEVSKLLVEAGLITLVSFISPFRSERQLARNLLQDDEFFEVFVDAPLAVCEQRDPKGLYKKARAGEIPNFTGIGSDYEPPENPELHLSASVFSAEQLAEQVITLLRNQGIIAAE
ncbi:MAG: sulfate adenylyltransferase subunit CysN [Rhodospirillaceae bacterium]